MTDWPIRDPAKLSDWLRAQARDPRTTSVIVTIHLSELAMLVRSLDILATQEAVESETHQRASLAAYGVPWSGHQDDPTLSSASKGGYLYDLTEDELLEVMEVGGYTEPAVIRESTRPKEYGQGQYGPVEIRRPGWPPSACGPSTPVCLPAFGILGRTPDTDASSDPSADAAAPHTDRTAAARTRSVRRGLGET